MVESGDYMFMGEFKHTIDSKGRIIIPSKFRSELGSEFIITKGLDHCLFVYSKEEFKNITNNYKQLPNTKEARNYLRIFLSGAIMVEIDTQGRINLSESLINYAELIKDCIIIGVNERLEIWNKDKWEQFLIDNEKSLSEIADNLFKTKGDICI